jgi:hypothetical protein
MRIVLDSTCSKFFKHKLMNDVVSFFPFMFLPPNENYVHASFTFSG